MPAPRQPVAPAPVHAPPQPRRWSRRAAPRVRRLRLAPIALLAGLAAPAAAQAAPIETWQPGPHAVGSADWDFGVVPVTEPGSGGASTIDVAHFGTVRYPAVAPGPAQQPLRTGPFPFVVFAHGRFHAEPFIGHNHEQAAYLLDHLASWGFVAAAVNLDVVGQYAGGTIKPRGELITATIDAFAALDPQQLVADFERTALVGHSRGGEGCLAAFKAEPRPGRIRAIATIAPTSFQQLAPEGVAYLGLYGSKDGDVNNGWPIQVYERVAGSEKAFEWIEGANHFWFTESIHFSGEGNAGITRLQHHEVARTYIAAFLRAATSVPALPFDELCDGPSLAPVTGVIGIHPLYEPPDALVVNGFEELPADAGSNTLGGVSGGLLLSALGEESLDNAIKTFYHSTRGLRIGHDLSVLGAGAYAEQLGGGLDLRDYAHVSLRALQAWGAPANAAGEPQDLKLLLLDGAARVVLARLSQYGTIPWPVTHGGPAFPKKSVLRTTRIPLADLAEQDPAFDWSDVRFLGLVLDLTPSSDLRIDTLSFTR